MKSKRVVLRIAALVATATLLGSALSGRIAAADDATTPMSAESLKPGFNPADLDPTCKACDDFYTFATGGWQKQHPIPAGYAAWGTLNEIAETNRNILHGILDDAARDTAAPASSNQAKIGTFYRACMDEPGIERAGLAPLRPMLDAIASIHDTTSLVVEMAALDRAGVDVPINIGARPNAVDSTRQIARLSVGGLGLPDRDFYFRDDAKSQAVRASYATYVRTLLNLGGASQSLADADAPMIVSLETAIAQATPPRVDLRDPQKTYHPMSVADLSKLTPSIAWPSVFAAAGTPPFTTLNVAAPDYLKAIDGEVGSAPLGLWRAYLRFHVTDAYAPALPKAFVDASFDFHSTTLYGVHDQLPRWKRCTTATDRALGEALGAVYVQKVFPPAAKARAQALVDNLQGVLNDDIATLPWMSAPTKTYAQTKLAAFTKKIGYPATFRDYSALDITAASYAGNLARVHAFDTDRELRRIGGPTARAEWGMTPPTVNAYYNPPLNEIVFPAGILTPPLFREDADDAANYGAIGAVIGHEMTHGFDNAGREYDAQGNLRDWWTPADTTAFTTRAQCIIDEYSAFSPAPGANIQGKLVQGEAIADLGGLTIAYKAFARTDEFKAGKLIDGYTPQQRFFLAFARVWAQNELPDAARNQALTNEHPDDRYRVIGTLSNMPEFRAAFHCAATDKMVRAQSCQIW